MRKKVSIVGAGNVHAVTLANLEQRILLVRGHKVMLSHDSAVLYPVEPKVLNQAVKRNVERFPEDFMFQRGLEESANLKSQFGTSGWGGARRTPPYAFTEQGVAMLSSVLHSPRAIQVNIAVMRAFVKLRDMLSSHRELSRKLNAMEKKYDVQFKAVFGAIRELMKPPDQPRKRIGF